MGVRILSLVRSVEIVSRVGQTGRCPIRQWFEGTHSRGTICTFIDGPSCSAASRRGQTDTKFWTMARPSTIVVGPGFDGMVFPSAPESSCGSSRQSGSSGIKLSTTKRFRCPDVSFQPGSWAKETEVPKTIRPKFHAQSIMKLRLISAVFLLCCQVVCLMVATPGLRGALHLEFSA